MLAGIGVRDITPEPGVPMWGYSNRSGPSTGALDALKAQAIVLRGADTTVAVVTMDLGRAPARPAMDRIRERAAAIGVTHVVFTASHTHGGPVMEDESAPHATVIEARLGDCIDDAVAQLEPVRIGVGHTAFDIGHNRRVLTEDGRCLMLWRNAERIPTSPVDAEATIIAFERTDGSRFATLVHFACHPVVLGSDNREITADWVGEMYRAVERETGAPCLFLQGGAGDINPYLDKTPLSDGGVDAMRAVGKECATAILSALPKITASEVAQPRLAYREEMVEVGTRWDFQDPEHQEVFRAVYGGMFDRYLDDLEADLHVPLSVLTINDDLALAFMPGELFVQFQLDLKTKSPVRDTLLVGYANDFHIYFPTIKDAAAGGYGGTTATYVGLGAGEKLVTRALVAAGELTGRLRPNCTPEDFRLIEYAPTMT
ncbi:MAG: hypothetical protein AMXMBFR82_27110 [Candidatus Hydrogenedentota bacterium]